MISRSQKVRGGNRGMVRFRTYARQARGPARASREGAAESRAESPAALRREADRRLERELTPDGRSHYIYRYEGVTCTFDRTPLPVRMHAVIARTNEGPVFENGWIELDGAELGLSRSCGFLIQGEPMIEELERPPAFLGMPLSRILSDLTDVEVSRCFCTRQMLDHKWRVLIQMIQLTDNGDAQS